MDNWENPQSKNNYMAKFLSDKSLAIIAKIKEEIRLKELEKPKPKGRKKK